MTHYTIEKDVPIPPYTKVKKREPRTDHKYPLGLMEVGDSFTAPDSDRKSVRVCMGKSPHGRFTSRRLSHKGETIVRVWRIA